jgi:hypothetical protein
LVTLKRATSSSFAGAFGEWDLTMKSMKGHETWVALAALPSGDKL